MRLLVDTNVLLDVILARTPWVGDAAGLLATIELGRTEGFVAAHAITTIFYLVAKARGREVARTAVSDLLRLFAVVPLDAADFQRALAFGLADYEDAVEVAAALRAGTDCIVTRNARDYRGAPIPVRSAGEILAFVRSIPEGRDE